MTLMTQLTAPQCHGTSYFDDGDLYFLVENYYFCVHRSVFERESDFLGRLTAGQAKGGTQASALSLNDVRLIDFEHFLAAIYNPQRMSTLEEWSSVLDLANRWGFAQVKDLAVCGLEKIEMEDVDRIALYHKHGVDRKILIPRYSALGARDYSLTVEEGNKLGMETTIFIAHARDCARSYMSLGGGDTPMPYIDTREYTTEDFLRDITTSIFINGRTP